MIRDAERQKMSKSKGNVVDPLEICDKYGTDAVRFAFARMGVPGTDLTLQDKQLESYKFFATKIWNAARFIYQYVTDSDRLATIEELRSSDLPLVDRWILARLARATQEVRQSMEQYHLHEATRSLELDYFVMFSSVAGVWGSKRQAHYSTANHFGFAHATVRSQPAYRFLLPLLDINLFPNHRFSYTSLCTLQRISSELIRKVPIQGSLYVNGLESSSPSWA
jgi:cysteinyl-tRNA synthetase